ncbi:MAG: sigma 54-interacting transcriptional regulator [Phycisphaerae bacterium]
MTAQDDSHFLRTLVLATARSTGEDFFRSLTQNLAAAMNVHYAFVAVFTAPTRVKAIAYWAVDSFRENIEWDLAGTPCEDVVKGKLCHYPANVAASFPTDDFLVQSHVESYLGVPLIDTNGKHLGHLAVFDTQPLPSEPRRLSIFQLFASRAAAELERLDMQRELEQRERQFRDLYEEAPIAYVHEDADTRFVSANRTAMNLLGLTPEDIPHTVGLSLVADTPENKAAVQKALAALAQGREQSIPVLELRRKDNGQPLWVQWWSRPITAGADAAGRKLTRTMFIDITAQVLAEREKKTLHEQNLYLQEEIKAAHNFEEIVGNSPALLAALDKVQRVANTDASVLILGETGTGKELIARAIHNAGPRKQKPLIKINCAALPSGLVESELFGHEKGAFSGAIARRVGRFELANTGTIFLDEVAELPLDTQAKLLRVLQEREFERVGGTATIKVDVRLIAATNRDLKKLVAENKFRQDLFYRLHVFPIHLPPLRDRPKDIPLLVSFLLDKFKTRIGKLIPGISADTLRLLQSYPWPGNIRELENVLERAVILTPDNTPLQVDRDLLPTPPDPLQTPHLSAPNHPQISPKPVENRPHTAPNHPDTSLKSLERDHILTALTRTNWIIDGPRGAAKLLDLHPNTLRSRLQKLGLKRPGNP